MDVIQCSAHRHNNKKPMATILNNTQDQPLVATVMVIDDQLTSRIIFETVLRSIGDEIKVNTFDNPISALRTVEMEPPDLIIVDYKMPELNGVEFTRKLRQLPSCHDIPIIIITVVDERAVLYEALEAGATDFLIKPVDHYEYKVRCKNLLAMRRRQLIIRKRTNSLETQMLDAIEQIRTREEEVLFRLARAGEFKDSQTGEHQARIGKISRILATGLGLNVNFCNIIEIAAPLHDIGKIGIPDRILLKQESLDADEIEIMKTHTTIGYEILKDSPSHYLKMGAVIALNHHEKFSGGGYPTGRDGKDIPIEARIVAAADVFDALISTRPYKDPFPVQSAIDEINKLSGEHLDPECVQVLCAHIDAVLACNNLTDNSVVDIENSL